MSGMNLSSVTSKSGRADPFGTPKERRLAMHTGNNSARIGFARSPKSGLEEGIAEVQITLVAGPRAHLYRTGHPLA